MCGVFVCVYVSDIFSPSRLYTKLYDYRLEVQPPGHLSQWIRITKFVFLSRTHLGDMQSIS